MSFLDDEKVLGFIPIGQNAAVKVTTGKGTQKRKKGKPIVDIRVCTRDDSQVDTMVMLEEITRDGFSTNGLVPTKSGLHLVEEDFKELMEKFLLPHYASLVE